METDLWLIYKSLRALQGMFATVDPNQACTLEDVSPMICLIAGRVKPAHDRVGRM